MNELVDILNLYYIITIVPGEHNKLFIGLGTNDRRGDIWYKRIIYVQ